MQYKKIRTIGKKMAQTIINKKDRYDTGMYGEILYTEFDDYELPVVGKKYMVLSFEDVSPNVLRAGKNVECIDWRDDPELIERGMGGNMDNNIKRFHGWRGTTCDSSKMAHGVRICTKSERIELKTSVHYKIEFGMDLVADRD